jgi:16S rRNA U516 pseudouridylate synthase RsuA-like enzyme
MNIPDFTRGAWKTNQPVNLTLDGGGNTEVRKMVAAGDKQVK